MLTCARTYCFQVFGHALQDADAHCKSGKAVTYCTSFDHMNHTAMTLYVYKPRYNLRVAFNDKPINVRSAHNDPPERAPVQNRSFFTSHAHQCLAMSSVGITWRKPECTSDALLPCWLVHSNSGPRLIDLDVVSINLLGLQVPKNECNRVGDAQSQPETCRVGVKVASLCLDVRAVAIVLPSYQSHA